MYLMRKLKHHEIPRADPARAIALPKHPIDVVADNIRSIHNVGSIFRTADAAGLQHVYLCGYTGTPQDRRLHKTALGAQDVVSWTHAPDALDLIADLKERGVTVAALEITTRPRDTDELTPEDFPLALIVGNEIDGVSDALIEQCDFAIEIPQYGTKQSLNVSVAFGIAAFGLVRRYRSLNDMPVSALPVDR